MLNSYLVWVLLVLVCPYNVRARPIPPCLTLLDCVNLCQKQDPRSESFGDCVEPTRADIEIIEGMDLELQLKAHVPYLYQQCRWAYNDRDNVFLHISKSVGRDNVLDRDSTWNFTDPMKPCLGIKKVASIYDAGEYFWSMGDFGSTIDCSRPITVTVHRAADITFTIEMGETIHNYSLKDGRYVRLPDVGYGSGSIPVSVRLPANMKNSRVSIEPSGEKVCSNSTTCESVIDLKNNSITITIDTGIDGVGQIVIYQSFRNVESAAGNTPAEGLGIVVALLSVAVILLLIKLYKSQFRRKMKQLLVPRRKDIKTDEKQECKEMLTPQVTGQHEADLRVVQQQEGLDLPQSHGEVEASDDLSCPQSDSAI